MGSESGIGWTDATWNRLPAARGYPRAAVTAMQIEWLESIVAQCQAANVAMYVKQDSALYPGTQGRILDALWALKEYPE